MENQRLLLYFTLFFIVYLLWAEWQMDYGPKPAAAPDTASVATEQQAPSSTTETATAAAAVPEATAVRGEAALVDDTEDTSTDSQRIRVITDVLDVEIDTRGGDIRRAILRNYSKTADNPEDKLVLMTDDARNYFVAQSGLVSVNKNTAPTHNAIYSSAASSYRLAEGVNEVHVPLTWKVSSALMAASWESRWSLAAAELKEWSNSS